MQFITLKARVKAGEQFVGNEFPTWAFIIPHVQIGYVVPVEVAIYSGKENKTIKISKRSAMSSQAIGALSASNPDGLTIEELEKQRLALPKIDLYSNNFSVNEVLIIRDKSIFSPLFVPHINHDINQINRRKELTLENEGLEVTTEGATSEMVCEVTAVSVWRSVDVFIPSSLQ